MNGIGDRKVCSFCGENIASDFKRCPYCGSFLDLDGNYSTDSSLDFVDTINNDVDDDSAYKFEKTINDSTSVADFTRQDVSFDQYDDYNENDFVLKEMLENKETPFGGLNEHAGDNFGQSTGWQKPQVQQAGMQDSKPYNPDVSGRYVNNKNDNDMRKPLSNGTKVFMVTLSNLLPGIGQLFGVISAIVFINAGEDKDRKSFGAALLISSVIAFVVTILAFAFLVLCFA